MKVIKTVGHLSNLEKMEFNTLKELKDYLNSVDDNELDVKIANDCSGGSLEFLEVTLPSGEVIYTF
jgi:hypothetical protein